MGKTDSIQVPIFAGEPQDYEADFHAWSMEQSSRLRLLRIPGLDTENMAEEIESLGRSDKRELGSRSEVLLMHLLKWKYQPARCSKSWAVTVLEQRLKIESLLGESPSLRPSMPTILLKSYPLAVKSAVVETDLPVGSFPHVCEWTAEQILSEDFLPD
jgi:hypothetical protein